MELSDEAAEALVAVLPRLHRFALVLTRSPADADDLVQAACERALRAPERWPPLAVLDRWMFRVGYNLWCNQHRDQRNRARLLDGYGDGLPDHEDGAARADATVELARLRAHVLALPAEQRAPLLLVAVEGLTYQETAAVLDLPLGTVTSRIARAREALRDPLGAAPREVMP